MAERRQRREGSGRAPRTPGMRAAAAQARADRRRRAARACPSRSWPAGRPTLASARRAVQTRRELIASGAARRQARRLHAHPAASLAARALRRSGCATNRDRRSGPGGAALRAHAVDREPGIAARRDGVRGQPGTGGRALLDAARLLLRRADHRARRLVPELQPEGRAGARRELGARARSVVDGGDLPSGEEVFFLDGAHYSAAEANEDWEALRLRGLPGAASAGKLQRSGEARLDAMSVPEWLDSTPIGAGSRFGRLMHGQHGDRERRRPGRSVGARSDRTAQPATRRRSLQPLPGDDERYHLTGGNDQLVSRMIAAAGTRDGATRP